MFLIRIRLDRHHVITFDFEHNFQVHLKTTPNAHSVGSVSRPSSQPAPGIFSSPNLSEHIPFRILYLNIKNC